LGLPNFYVPFRYDELIPKAIARLRHLSAETLVETISSKLFTLEERLAAGQLLNFVGDPRIQDFQHTMIEVKGGTVEIGLAKKDLKNVLANYKDLGLIETWIEKECPRHAVKLKDFYIAKYPVTNSQYKAFLLETNHTEIPSSWTFRRFPIERANHPVYTISPQSADSYAAWLASKTGITYRLPTEAEWEWAASGPKQSEFPWGQEFNPFLANTAETGLLWTSSVGAFVGGESYFGVCDMAGNVEEYVSDLYSPYPNGKHIKDHLVQLNGDYRVARGGSFARFRDLARTRRRHGHNPKSETYAMGFRLAVDSK